MDVDDGGDGDKCPQEEQDTQANLNELEALKAEMVYYQVYYQV